MVAPPVLAKAVDLDRPTEFDIESQSVGSALLQFSKQAHIQVVLSPTVSGSAEASPLHGKVLPRVALDTLLRDTGLEYTPVGKSVIVTLRNTMRSEVSAEASVADPAGESESATVNGGSSNANKSGLEEVVVTSTYQFLSVDTSGTTNLPLPIERVPQSISLVSNDFIQAADLKTLGEIAEYTAGAINIGNSENVGSLIKLRGFTAGQSIDGINILSPTQIEPDYAIYDRLEFVKGPSSVVYGISSPGGLVNFVTKSATDRTPSYVLAQAGFWSNYRVEGQIAGALDPENHVRGIGVAVYDRGNSFTDVVNHKRTTLYGGLNFDLGNSVTAYLHGGYERQVVTSFDTILVEPDGSLPPVPRSFFVGSRNIDTSTTSYHAEGDVTWHATEMLDFSLKGNYRTYHVGGGQVYPSGLGTQPSGDPGDFNIYGVSAEDIHEIDYGIGASSVYRLDDLGLKSSFLSVAALYQQNIAHTNYLTPDNFTATANIFAGEASIGAAFDSLLAGPSSPSNETDWTKTLTISAQSSLQLLDPLAVLLGASWSKPKQSVAVNGPGTEYDYASNTSYRAGITYEVLPKTFAYVSYSESFNPQTGTTADLKPLTPLEGRQYEAGVKFRSANGRLLLTGNVFHIREANFKVFDVNIEGSDHFKTVGVVTHKGAELEALGQVTPEWQLNMSYAYLDPQVTTNKGDAAVVGQSELYLPKQTASLYSTYTFPEGILRGLAVGGGVRYVASQQTSYRSDAANAAEGLSATRDIPGYTLVDATLSYTRDAWLVKLNGHNILDRHYYFNTYSTLAYGVSSGDPSNVSLSARYQF